MLTRICPAYKLTTIFRCPKGLKRELRENRRRTRRCNRKYFLYVSLVSFDMTGKAGKRSTPKVRRPA